MLLVLVLLVLVQSQQGSRAGPMRCHMLLQEEQEKALPRAT